MEDYPNPLFLLVPATICRGGPTYRMPKIFKRSCHFSLWKTCSGWSYWWGLSLGWWIPSECSIVWEDAWQCFWHLGWGKAYRGQHFFAIFHCLILPLAVIFLWYFCFNPPGGGRNPWTLKVNLADIGDHGDSSWYLLCMGIISTGKSVSLN